MKKNKTTFMHAYLSAALMLALSITFTACSPEDEEGKGNAAGAVDLGLSVKWATCNVGAEKPEDLGDYYAWGETEKKTEYTEDTYKHAEDKDGDGDFYDDLNNWEDIGSNISGTPYDVARAKWGGKWRMPTVEEAEELLGKCSWEWTTVNGTNGYTVTGPNGNSIFLPATGYSYDDDTRDRNSSGNYWLGTQGDLGPLVGEYLFFNNRDSGPAYCNRSWGLSVRPVRGE